MTAASRDEALMRRALAAAELGPEADPNPRVGCVIATPEGSVITQGHHRGAGTAHAEVDALTQAGERARGATAYVTLEPCAHTGRTGPCAQALYAAGVARVVIAQSDPNPVASGGGQWLRDQGVQIDTGLLRDEAQELNRSWTHLMHTGRPLVTWKFAATLDGRSAAADGTSQWITGPLARADVHAQRARCGAIVVGTGTALADDPALTARESDGTLRAAQPIRVVVGQRDLPATAKVLNEDAPTWHLKTRDPHHVLEQLARAQVHHAWLEGGPALAGSFLAAGLVDEVIAYIAPTLLGSGRACVGDLGIETISDAIRLRTTKVTTLGEDIRITASPATRTTDSAKEPH